MKSKAPLILIGLAILLTVTFIFHNSLTVSVVSNAESNAIADTVKPVMDPGSRITTRTFRALIRKAAHVTEFAALGAGLTAMGLILVRGSWKRLRSHICAPLFAVLMVAVLDEFIQSFTGRTSCLKDVLIDFGGGLIGLAVTAAIWAILRKRTRKAKGDGLTV